MQEDLEVRLSKFVIKHRWWMILAISIVSVGLSIVTEIDWKSHQVPKNVFWEILMLGVLIPLSYGAVLTLLARAEERRLNARLESEFQKILSQQLNQASTRGEVLDIILRYPSTILPVQWSAVYLYHPDKSSLLMEQFWRSEFHTGLEEQEFPNHQDLGRCLASQLNTPGEMKSCSCGSPLQGSTQGGYCLELRYMGNLTGILYIHLPPETEAPSLAVQALKSIAPQMGQALERVRLQRLALKQAEAAENERRRIAQNLHDTLGQNISYLRLKLDQLNGEDPLAEISLIKQDLERMRELADDAYQQVRGTLADLGLSTISDLASALCQMGQTVSKRANLQFELESNGSERAIPASTRRQIILIFREAMNNIEKHAHASLVRMCVAWGTNDLTISMTDDGKGFDPYQTIPLGHYGLTIMQERAAEISGRLSWKSSGENGTITTLWVPLPIGERSG
jgi:signal transduction histidine kinase